MFNGKFLFKTPVINLIKWSKTRRDNSFVFNGCAD